MAGYHACLQRFYFAMINIPIHKIDYSTEGVLIRFNYTMHNKFSNCFVWVSPSKSELKFHFLAYRYKRRLPDINFHVKIYRFFNRSGCTNVTLDFETSVQSGYLWSQVTTKNIFKPLLSHWNLEKAKQKLAFAEFPSRNEVPSFHNLTFLMMLLPLSLLNDVSNRYFLNHFIKYSC